jgi:isoprenylcysteine carboxyl methyltransferase (ICMT) family protein YpbQ
MIRRAGLLVLLAIFIVFLAPSFIKHAAWLSSGEGFFYIIKNRWDLVILNILFFASFIVLIPFKRKVSKLPSSVYIAFIVALFLEMYGFPLTAYFLFSRFGGFEVYQEVPMIVQFDFFGTEFGMTAWMVFGLAITLIGLLLIVLGWSELYRHIKQGTLATGGIYKYMRHPQYLGFYLVTLGWFIGWPTIIGAVMWPVLVLLYYRLARSEEREVEKQFGKKYKKYKAKTPMFFL